MKEKKEGKRTGKEYGERSGVMEIPNRQNEKETPKKEGRRKMERE